MYRLVIIDDDYAQEILAEHLAYRGYEVCRIDSPSHALRDLDSIVSANLVILDIIMQAPYSHTARTTRTVSGARTTGMVIYRQIRTRNPDMPILAYSASQDKDIIDIFNSDPNSRFLSKWSTPSMREIVSAIDTMLGIKSVPPQPTTFIVHGHNETIKLQLKNYIQNTLGLPEPIILHEQPNSGRTLISKFEEYALKSNLAFILLTPDDKIADGSDSNVEKRRARQNVIFELGFFLGVLGRESGRVLLLHSGPLELPSDLNGVVYIDISDGIEAVGEQIRRELGSAI